MKSDSIDNRSRIEFIDVHELKFFMEQPYFLKKDIELKDVILRLSMDHGVNLKVDNVGVDIITRYFYLEDKNPVILVEYITRTEFYIENLKEFLDGKFLADDYLFYCVEVALHMTRGMLAIKLHGTDYRNFLPPIYNSQQLISEFKSIVNHLLAQQEKEMQVKEEEKGQ